MKASELILDLLRTYGNRGTSVQDIATAGELFGFTANTIRVNLTRLASKGAIEPVSRGQYRMCESTAVVNDFAESWRQGEGRVKPWITNTWISAHLVKPNDKSKWVLTNYGYREISMGLWTRPSNLDLSFEILAKRLIDLGVPVSAVIMDQAQLPSEKRNDWVEHFNLDEIQNRYVSTRNKLKESLDRLSQLPRSAAMKESFMLGGQAIEVLAKDPLIPEQYLAPTERHRLWEVLLKYDQAGRDVWTSASNHAPDALITPNSKLMSMQL